MNRNDHRIRPPHVIMLAVVGLAAVAPIFWMLCQWFTWQKVVRVVAASILKLLLFIPVFGLCLCMTLLLLQLMPWIGLCLRYDLRALRHADLTGKETLWTTGRLLMVVGGFWLTIGLTVMATSRYPGEVKLLAVVILILFLAFCLKFSFDDDSVKQLRWYPKQWKHWADVDGLPLGEQWIKQEKESDSDSE